MKPIPLQFIGVYLSEQSARRRQSVASVGVVDAHGRLLFCAQAPFEVIQRRKLPGPSWVLDVISNRVGPCIEPWEPIVFSSIPSVSRTGAQERPTVAASASSSLLTALKFCKADVFSVPRKELANFAGRGGRKGAKRERVEVIKQRFGGLWANRPFPGEEAAMGALLAELGRERSQERIAS